LSIFKLFARRRLYLVWALASAALLVTTCYIDPYVFGFTAMGAAWLTGAVVVTALIAAPRRLGWAILSSIPTLCAFARLSTYDWA
jgi:hypothetical protein